MKRLPAVLAFLVICIPASGLGLIIGVSLAEDGGKSIANPIAGVIVGLFSVCLGISGGTYAARMTSRHYSRGATSIVTDGGRRCEILLRYNLWRACPRSRWFWAERRKDAVAEPTKVLKLAAVNSYSDAINFSHSVSLSRTF